MRSSHFFWLLGFWGIWGMLWAASGRATRALFWPAAAASGLQLRILHVQDDAFPLIQVRFWLWDNDRREVPALRLRDITLQEDGHDRPVERFSWMVPHYQWVIALNPDRGFALRDNQGVSRYTYIYYQLKSWLDTLPQGPHRLTLLLREQVLVNATDDPQRVVEALEAYQPTRKEAAASPNALAVALEKASQKPEVPETVQGVLFITAALDQDALARLPDLARQAREAHVQVMVWVVGNPAVLEAQRGPWESLARATGGHVALFSGVEVLPDLKVEFARRGRVYVVAYRSARKQGGRVALRLRVQAGSRGAATASTTFHLQLAPPAPRLEDVPPTITLHPVTGTATAGNRFRPSQWRLAFHIAFPDGRFREIRQVRLLLDGRPINQWQGPGLPEYLMWNLTPVSPGPHTLQLEAEDAWGLIGRSPVYTVHLRIAETTTKAAIKTRNQIASGASQSIWLLPALLGVLLMALLAWGTWLEYQHRRIRSLSGGTRSLTKGSKDHQGLWLVPLEQNGPVLHIPEPEAVIGSSEEGTTLTLKHPSVSARHARFWKDQEAGHFYVADLASTSGTWVNFAPVSEAGMPLEEGDILHVGSVGFRVRYSPPPS